MKKLILKALLATAAVIPLASQAITVNTAADVDLASLPYITPGVMNARNDGKCSLAEAVELANWTYNSGTPSTKPTLDCGTAQSSMNVITFAADIKAIQLVFKKFSQAAFEINSPIEIKGNKPGTILSGFKTKNRIFRLGASWSQLKMTDMAMVNAVIPTGGGAAVLVDSSAARFECFNCAFENNEAGDDGGAIHSKASLQLDDQDHLVRGVSIVGSVFINNAATRGGAYFGPPMYAAYSTFYQNKARRSGGALHVTTGSTLEIYNSAFTDNVAQAPQSFSSNDIIQGGAIFSDAVLYVGKSRFQRNVALPSFGLGLGSDAQQTSGGAIHIGTAAAVFDPNVIEGSMFEGNIAGYNHGRGGALGLDQIALIRESGFIGNMAASGFAVYAKTSLSHAVKIVNSTIADNRITAETPDYPDLLPSAGSVVNAGTAPVTLINSFVHQRGQGSALLTQPNSAATILIGNTAVGAELPSNPAPQPPALPLSDKAATCTGNITDMGANVQSKTNVGAGCPATVPFAANSDDFVSVAYQTTQDLFGVTYEPLGMYYALPGGGVMPQMQGKGLPALCSGSPADSKTQLGMARTGCDIGPVNL